MFRRGHQALNHGPKSFISKYIADAISKELEVEGRWQTLWGLKVPPKVRDCMWRIARDCLPHKVNLFQKKVVDDKWCVLCGSQLEDTWHVFFSCRYALDCWDASGLRDKIELAITRADNFLDVIFRMLGDYDRTTGAIWHGSMANLEGAEFASMGGQLQVSNRCGLRIRNGTHGVGRSRSRHGRISGS